MIESGRLELDKLTKEYKKDIAAKNEKINDLNAIIKKLKKSEESENTDSYFEKSHPKSFGYMNLLTEKEQQQEMEINANVTPIEEDKEVVESVEVKSKNKKKRGKEVKVRTPHPLGPRKKKGVNLKRSGIITYPLKTRKQKSKASEKKGTNKVFDECAEHEVIVVNSSPDVDAELKKKRDERKPFKPKKEQRDLSMIVCGNDIIEKLDAYSQEQGRSCCVWRKETPLWMYETRIADFVGLLETYAIRTNLLDCWSQVLLERHNNSERKNVNIKMFVSNTWMYVHSEMGNMIANRLHRVLENNAREVAFILFPPLVSSRKDTTSKCNHYIPLVLDVFERKWTYYNSLSERRANNLDSYVHCANDVAQAVTKYLTKLDEEEGPSFVLTPGKG